MKAMFLLALQLSCVACLSSQKAGHKEKALEPETPDPDGESEDSKDFVQGTFSDPNHMGFTRDIEFGDENSQVVITGKDSSAGDEWELKGTYDEAEKVVKVDFSPKGGPKDLVGKVDDKGGIHWPDGNVWSKLGGLTDTDKEGE